MVTTGACGISVTACSFPLPLPAPCLLQAGIAKNAEHFLSRTVSHSQRIRQPSIIYLTPALYCRSTFLDMGGGGGVWRLESQISFCDPTSTHRATSTLFQALTSQRYWTPDCPCPILLKRHRFYTRRS